MASVDIGGRWAPRVEPHKIRRLYENDARGIYDDDLIDDVGYGLLARCRSFVAAVAAVAGRAPCPRCGAVITHSGRREEVLSCGCGWEATWGGYFRTIQHKQLSGAEPVVAFFREYVDRFPHARTAREKLLLIDRVIHGFHIYLKDGSTTRPTAVNLIDARLGEVIDLLDSLAYGDATTPCLTETRDEWQVGIRNAKSWGKEPEASPGEPPAAS